MSVGLSFNVVGEENVVAGLRRTDENLDRLIDLAAEALSENIAAEASSVSSRLGEHWPVTSTSVTERHVESPEFFAHFLARGTASHGPRTAPSLAFAIDGTMIFAQFVSGIPGDPFDERAITRTESQLDTIVNTIIRESY